jgi:hypothetical protein
MIPALSACMPETASTPWIGETKNRTVARDAVMNRVPIDGGFSRDARSQCASAGHTWRAST